MTPDSMSARRIAMENLRPGMVLARDLHDEDNNIVLTSNTALDRADFNKIMLNAEQYVYILESTIDWERPSFLELEVNGSERVIPNDIPVKERMSFKQFLAAYKKTPKKLSGEFSNIGDGGNIDIKSLYELTDNVMTKLSTKNDVLVYINQLKHTQGWLHTHSVNVALLANLFGIWINLGADELEHLTVAALLHDIGMIKIPTQILEKEGPLTKEERDTMIKHTTYGYRILDTSDMPNEIKLAALGHHEKMDGTGYPLGVKSGKISKFAKIISICDVYEAMTADRTYRPRKCPFDVIKSFEREFFGIFDTEALLLFLQNIAYTYLNSRVLLTNGMNGRVVFINEKDLSSPIVMTDNDEVIDLHKNKDIRVMNLLEE